jgi:dTDP-glucose pyrophosphorylase
MTIEDIIAVQETTIKEALKMLDVTAVKVLLIVNPRRELIGTLTDGDIRRAILSGKDLSAPIEGVFNPDPQYFIENDYTVDQAKRLFLSKRIELIPILTNTKEVRSYLSWDDVFNEKAKTRRRGSLSLPVVIMAGGKGTRLLPFTNILPKALIPLGEKSILEHIIDGFLAYGIRRYCLSLNFKAEVIRAYFDGLEKDYEVSYIIEDRYLGTAGSLKLTGAELGETFIVSNCDILVKADYQDIYEHHLKSRSKLTILSSIQHHQIPYGVVEFQKGGEVTKILEKPEYTVPVNTGVYILSRECLAFIPENRRFDMTELIEILIKNRMKVTTYPVNENDYVDVGRWEEYQKVAEKMNTMW